jgi:hypothetical protein
LGASPRWHPTPEELYQYERLVVGRGPGGPPEGAELARHARAQIPLLREKARCLRPGTWLNDEAVNFYGALLQDRSLRLRRRDRRRRRAWRARARAAIAAARGDPRAAAAALAALGPPPPRHSAPRTHFFQTFFWNKLGKDQPAPGVPPGTYNYPAVRRWTAPGALKRAGLPYQNSDGGLLLCCDRAVVPVHVSQSHWCCAVVDFRLKAVAYLDSLGGRADKVLEFLLRWVEDEAREKLPPGDPRARPFLNARKEWRRIHPRVPQQRNGCDCGVFASLFADRLGLGVGVDFDGRATERGARVAIFSSLMAGSVPLEAGLLGEGDGEEGFWTASEGEEEEEEEEQPAAQEEQAPVAAAPVAPPPPPRQPSSDDDDEVEVVGEEEEEEKEEEEEESSEIEMVDLT